MPTGFAALFGGNPSSSNDKNQGGGGDNDDDQDAEGGEHGDGIGDSSWSGGMTHAMQEALTCALADAAGATMVTTT
jgi:hypothetical protein